MVASMDIDIDANYEMKDVGCHTEDMRAVERELHRFLARELFVNNRGY
jgi:hypothetical protein